MSLIYPYSILIQLDKNIKQFNITKLKYYGTQFPMTFMFLSIDNILICAKGRISSILVRESQISLVAKKGPFYARRLEST